MPDREEDVSEPPREEEVSVPPREEDALAPPREEDALTPLCEPELEWLCDVLLTCFEGGSGRRLEDELDAVAGEPVTEGAAELADAVLGAGRPPVRVGAGTGVSGESGGIGSRSAMAA